ncbi:MAG: hypothetical protein C4545_07505 [Anaerolineaceae bacterium]|nr:MAG: hypothetical protein C4545_07505 [Anaerolineaceae bacterium]
MNDKKIEDYEAQLNPETLSFIEQSINKIVEAKEKGKKVAVILGSGPNLHEGVTTLMAELMDKGVIDGLSTSSAVISHELAGVLDKVKRVNGLELGIDSNLLPKGDFFEITQLSPEWLEIIDKEMYIDHDLIQRGNRLDGSVIIKAAGNMGYPMGLRSERIAKEILGIAKAYGLSFETVAGWGADPRTMIGTGARKGLPVLVSVPQLIGGGGVGLCIGDSISITERCMKMAQMLESADVLIESAVALTQEIHDGPFETYTGHGVWGNWDGYKSYSLKNKTLIRIDLDPNLKRAWDLQRQDSSVQKAIDQGLPKTKLTGIPFRMEMSGFARLETSIPVVGDIGLIWPIIAWHVAKKLNIKLDYINHPQQTEEGQRMREWLVNEIRPFDRDMMIKSGQTHK